MFKACPLSICLVWFLTDLDPQGITKIYFLRLFGLNWITNGLDAIPRGVATTSSPTVEAIGSAN